MKIVFISNYAGSLVNFRGQLIRKLVADGMEVVALAPDSEMSMRQEVEALGARCYGYTISRASLNPMGDLATYRDLKRILKRENPDIVLSYTAKPMIYGSLAAASAAVPRIVSLVTGLGYAFSGDSIKQRAVRWVQKKLYRLAFRSNDVVIFQNQDDRDAFIDWQVVDEVRSVIVSGSGIDMEAFPREKMPTGEPFTFLMVARLLREKGIREFLSAARKIKEETRSRVKFVLVGGIDPNPGGLAEEEILAAAEFVEWKGEQKDVRPFLKKCHCFVLPSYREGLPRSTLEALATGRPIVTTDSVGCRETVIEGKNGYKVSPQNADALAGAMIRVLETPVDELDAMGEASHSLAKSLFEVNLVNRKMKRYILPD